MMLKLIRLELRRNRMKGYVIAVSLITGAMLALSYLFALLPRVEGSKEEMELFMTYHGIISLICVISMACFSVLSAVMFNRFVVEEYTSKKAILLFSYPVDRSCILRAKVLTVFLFSVSAMIVSGVISFSVFFSTEAIFHFVPDTMTRSLLLQTFVFVVSFSLIAISFALVSLWFGYQKKSASATIVTDIILISIFNNLLVIGIPNALAAVVVGMVCVMIGGIFIRGVKQKILNQEI